MEIDKGERKCNYLSLEQTARHKILIVSLMGEK